MPHESNIPSKLTNPEDVDAAPTGLPLAVAMQNATAVIEQAQSRLREPAMWIVKAGQVELLASKTREALAESDAVTIGSFAKDDVFFYAPESDSSQSIEFWRRNHDDAVVRTLSAEALGRLVAEGKIPVTHLQSSLIGWMERVIDAVTSLEMQSASFTGQADVENLPIELAGEFDLQKPGAIWDAVQKFQMHLVDSLTEWASRSEGGPAGSEASKSDPDRVEIDRITRKTELIERDFLRSLDQIGDVMNDSPSMAPHPDWDEDALAFACRAIGKCSGLKFTDQSRADKSLSDQNVSLFARVKTFAAASGVSMRKVSLDGRWWTQDSGPLLAFAKNSQEPVALLPLRYGGYQWVAVSAKNRTKVNREVAAQLDRDAVMFYRPFPNKPMGVRDILIHGIELQKRDLVRVLLFGLCAGAIGATVPYLTGVIFDSAIPGAQRGQLLQICALLLAGAIAMAMMQLTKAVALWRIETKATHEVQAAVWDRLIRLPATFFRKFTAGDLTMRAYRIDGIRRILSGTVLTSVLDAFFSIFYLVLLFFYSVKLAFIALGLVAFASTVVIGLNLRALKYDRKAQSISIMNSGRILEFISGIAKLRMSASEKSAFSIWARNFGQQRENEFCARSISNAAICFSHCFPILATVVIFHQFGNSLGTKPIATGHFLAFFAAFTIFLRSMLSLGDSVAAWMSIIPMYENAKPILQAVPEVNERKKSPGTLQGAIEMNCVSFRYSDDGPLILRDLSFRIEPGEFVAFVGPSGSGKSTIFRLLLGFETPETGTLYYDQQDLEGLDVTEVRHQMGVVLQNGKLMPGNLFYNIVGSSGDLTMDDAWKAAKMAGLDADIEAMPMGMHTFVSEGGGALSGGQCQRLLIARAIAKRPKILLMDEATSALDNHSQEIVSRSLDGINTTRIVIAHRLSTIVHADRILMLKDGVIAEEGKYEDLMKQDGLFAELAKRQIA